ncbi:hypothetical protein [Microcoleus sp. CAWBG58]|uniref:hypothetical protein n=1 Tax=Microcoleus sp. CAWBG58 TaxID=2841651 RepID=UPI0025E7DF41|nr:hypothetical protein [Microcoleus sp. CAWBG58]
MGIGNWELGIGNWAWGMGHGALGIRPPRAFGIGQTGHLANRGLELISCPVDYYNKKLFVVWTSVRSILRTKVRTTNGYYRGQSTEDDMTTNNQ